MTATDLTAVSLFAGVGGVDLALKRSGVRVVAAVEIDPAARKVLAKHFPDVTLFEDVREVTGDQLRAAGFVPERGLVAAGWPCQGNSIAGNRGGMADPRSGLWRHVVRLLAILRPAWFLGENVPGLLSVNRGDDFALVLDDLADLGMGFCWRVLDAQHFGVPQQRRRVIIVGRAGGNPQDPVQVLLEPEGGGRDSTSRRSSGQVVASLTANGVGAGGGPDDKAAQAGHLIASTVTHGTPRGAHALTSEGYDASEDGVGRSAPIVPVAYPVTWRGRGLELGKPEVANALRSSGDGHVGDQMGYVMTDAVRRFTPLECERLQGCPDQWTAGQADSPRYRQLGNTVAVPCIEWVTRRIVAVDSREVAA